MGESTVSDVYRKEAPRAASHHKQVLAIVMCASDLDIAPSCHVLDDIDVVTFRRGARGASLR